ncbi:MAG: thioredoxin domain-containing protein, partial [Opitutaceae bacterium]
MPNALAGETSPYLQQHAGNPVNWLPWGPEAFALARAEDRPIFLSIGYSTCHWCHVMARESFENEAIARLLNERFVPVKVDREERPDVDRVYMSYVQTATGHGGWPLSAWLSPDLKPFYGGTYFPPEDGMGRPGFTSVLRAIADGWAKDRARMVAEGDKFLASMMAAAPPSALSDGAEELERRLYGAAGPAFQKAFHYLYQGCDLAHGGFSGAPKFPRAANLSFLIRCAALQGPTEEIGAEAIRMAALTLQKMAGGGIHDHVGGGFHRYSVDEEWLVPHLEKMLYDQA